MFGIAVQTADHFEEAGGHGGLELHVAPGDGMCEAESARMEGEPTDRAGLGTIFAVADDWMSEFLGMDTNLILTPGFEREFYKGIAISASQHLVMGSGEFQALSGFGTGIYLIF